MAEHNYHQAGLQHLAHLRQDLVQHQGDSALRHQPQVALAEAGLEAHLQQQQALVAIQDLERQRLLQLPPVVKPLSQTFHNPNYKE